MWSHDCGFFYHRLDLKIFKFKYFVGKVELLQVVIVIVIVVITIVKMIAS